MNIQIYVVALISILDTFVYNHVIILNYQELPKAQLQR